MFQFYHLHEAAKWLLNIKVYIWMRSKNMSCDFLRHNSTKYLLKYLFYPSFMEIFNRASDTVTIRNHECILPKAVTHNEASIYLPNFIWGIVQRNHVISLGKSTNSIQNHGYVFNCYCFRTYQCKPLSFPLYNAYYKSGERTNKLSTEKSISWVHIS